MILTHLLIHSVYQSLHGAGHDLVYENGRFDLTGDLPTNTSGGLLGRGAPVGATGLAQAYEIMLQLRGEADPRRQVKGAKRGLTDTHAGTGTHCVVNIFESR